MAAILANRFEYFAVESGEGSPLVLLHGFTGSSASWAEVIDELAGAHRVVAFDLLGHGASAAPNDSSRYAFDTVVDDIACLAHELRLRPAVWLGYSIGGRLALGIAARRPDLVSGLILESATPGIEDPRERAARAASDLELAARIEEQGVPAFVAEWERLPLWHSQARLSPAALARQRQVRLQNRATGLANALRGLGQGGQEPLWQSLAGIEVPVLLIAGGLDVKYAGIASQMGDLLPHATVAIVPDAGHAVHLEQPRQFVEIVKRWLVQLELAGTRAH